VEKLEVKEVNRWLLQLAQSFAAGPIAPAAKQTTFM
jgi:hypothetical protein